MFVKEVQICKKFFFFFFFFFFLFPFTWQKQVSNTRNVFSLLHNLEAGGFLRILYGFPVVDWSYIISAA